MFLQSVHRAEWRHRDNYPGRRIGLGMPRSGPVDAFAFRMADVLVGNEPGMEGLETTNVNADWTRSVNHSRLQLKGCMNGLTSSRRF